MRVLCFAAHLLRAMVSVLPPGRNAVLGADLGGGFGGAPGYGRRALQDGAMRRRPPPFFGACLAPPGPGSPAKPTRGEGGLAAPV